MTFRADLIPPGHNYASLLWKDPPIVLGWTGRLFRFGAASALAPLFPTRRITFLLITKGSVADDDEARELADDAHRFMKEHPHHRFEWITNIDGETENLRRLGLSAHTHNQNIFLRDDIFRPVDAPTRPFHAIYNGRISPEKRNELAARIPSVGFITYRDPGEHSVETYHQACEELLRRVPGGHLLNALTETGSQRLTPTEVNAAYAQSDVGLCLSPREGAMRVAVEYQMAGLPIVATTCRGGRDHYYDPVTWEIVDADPDAIAAAVTRMQSRRLPRFMVRTRIMDRIAEDRRKFADFVQSLIVQEGGSGNFISAFDHLLRNDRFERWLSMREFGEEVWQEIQRRT